MKTRSLTILFLLSTLLLVAQTDDGFDAAKIKQNDKLAQYVTNLYNKSPFVGVKIVEGKDVSYLISLSVQTVSGNINTTNRIAQVKARRNAMQFLNGSNITSEQIMRTEETVTNNSVSYYETYIDKINENSTGFLAGMQLLTTFTSNNGKDYIYIIYTKL